MVRPIRGKKLSQRIKGVFSNFKLIAFIAVFTLALPITFYLTHQRQDIRQNASTYPWFGSTYCKPNTFVKGTFCLSTRACFDEYCNNTGTGTVSRYYAAGSDQCKHCVPTPIPTLYATPTSPCYECTTTGGGFYQPKVPTPTPTLPPVICSPSQFVAGTYCSNTSSCFDVYCSPDGRAMQNQNYSSNTCSFCATYKCSPNTFIAGTYFNGIAKYDIYCNSTGNGVMIHWY